MLRTRATTRRLPAPLRLLALAATIGLFATGCASQSGTESSLDVRPIRPTSANNPSSPISPLFWNVMADEGVTAGMHDGYQACLYPELDVVVFDIERFGMLVNPAFDAGYRAGSQAIADSCDALINDIGELADTSAAAKEQHRVSTVGANFDTLDSHPDFGKGFDATLSVESELGCDDAVLDASGPPKIWLLDYPSEFQSGYAAGLASIQRACAEREGLAYTDESPDGP